MACETYAQELQTIAGQLNQTIYRQTLTRSVWLNRVKQEAFPEGIGSSIGVVVTDIVPPDKMNWVAMTQTSDVAANTSCALTGDTLSYGSEVRQYSLYKAALNTDSFCIDKVRFSWQFRQQLANLLEGLKEVSFNMWSAWHRQNYALVSGNKILAGPAYQTSVAGSGSDFPAVAPTWKLTQGVLDWIYTQELINGAASKPAGMIQGRPLFYLITDYETSRSLIRDNPDIRQDYRFSSKADDLTAPLGLEGAYGGFLHVTDYLPRRFDFVNGAWIEYQPWTKVATTTGYKRIPNANYNTAAYTESYVFHDDVMKVLTPPDTTNMGGNVAFPNAATYRGEFSFRRPAVNKECNPDDNVGWFRAVFAAAYMPILANYGFTIRHLRCVASDGAGCTVSYS